MRRALNKKYAWLRVLGSSAKQHGGSTARSELCSILNRAIREDEPHVIIHAAVFAHALNMKLTEDKADPWLQKLFPKSYPYVNVGMPVPL